MAYEHPSSGDFEIRTGNSIYGQPDRPGARYADPFARWGVSGLGAQSPALHTNTELPAKLGAAKALDAQLTNLIAGVESGLRAYSPALEGSPQEDVLRNAQAAAQALQTAQSNLRGTFAGAGTTYGTFQGSHDAWMAVDAAEQEGRAALQRHSGVPAALQAAGRKAAAQALQTAQAQRDQASAARAAEVKAGADAAAQAQRDQATVNGALTRATALLGQGNFGGALAAVQAQNVVEAASRVGRAADLETASATIAYQQSSQEAERARQAKAEADRLASEQAARAGTVDAQGKVDAALAQAQALSSSGNFRGALLTLSSAMGPAAVTGRTTEVQMAMADVQQQQQDAQVEAKRAQAAARIDQAITQANNYAATGNFGIAQAVLNSIMGDATAAGRAGDVAAAQAAIEQAKAAQAAPPPAPVPVSAPEAVSPPPPISAGISEERLLEIIQRLLAAQQPNMATSVPGGEAPTLESPRFAAQQGPYSAGGWGGGEERF